MGPLVKKGVQLCGQDQPPYRTAATGNEPTALALGCRCRCDTGGGGNLPEENWLNYYDAQIWFKKTNTFIISKYFWEPNAWNYRYNIIIHHCVQKLFLRYMVVCHQVNAGIPIIRARVWTTPSLGIDRPLTALVGHGPLTTFFIPQEDYFCKTRFPQMPPSPILWETLPPPPPAKQLYSSVNSIILII